MTNDTEWPQKQGRKDRVEALRSRPEFCGPIKPMEEHDSADHLALIYESHEQHFEAVVPFIEQGLARNEQCLYIADENGRTDVLDALRAGGINVDRALENETLRVRSIADTYLMNGEFDPDEMIDFYAETIEDAVTETEALRVTAETGWVAEEVEAEDVMEYEARVNELFHDAAAIALCQYNRGRFSDAVIADVIKTHPHIVYEKTVSQNIYYTPPSQFVDREQNQERKPNPDQKLEWLLDISGTIHSQQARSDFLRDFHGIITDPDRSFEEKFQELIQRGCERFDHELGVLARTDPDTERFEIECTTGDHEYFQPGTILPLSETYCTALSEEKGVTDIPGPVGPDDSAITVLQEFGLQSHLGTYIQIDGAHNCVFFFVSAQPSNTSVTDAELTFHYFLGRWAKHTHETGLEEERRGQPGDREGADQVNELVIEIVQTLIEKPTRTDIEQTVCDQLAASDLYEAAWISEQPVTGRVTPSVLAGIEEEHVRAVTETSNRGVSALPARVLESHQPEVARVQDNPIFDPCRHQLRDEGIESVLAVPISYKDLEYGVLVVCAAEPETFDERQQTMLTNLGNMIGFAIAAVERKEAIATTEIVELELQISDPEFNFCRLTAETDATITLDGLIMQPDHSSIVYTTTRGATAETIQRCASELGDIQHVRLIENDDEGTQQTARFEFVLPSSTVIETFAEYGAVVTEATAEAGEVTLVVELPQTANVRAVVDAFQETVTDAEVMSKQTRERSGEITQILQRNLHELLTDKQREALRAGYFAGYFDRPRRTTGDELAATLDISSSTFHQHLQTALQKLLTAALNE